MAKATVTQVGCKEEHDSLEFFSAAEIYWYQPVHDEPRLPAERGNRETRQKSTFCGHTTWCVRAYNIVFQNFKSYAVSLCFFLSPRVSAPSSEVFVSRCCSTTGTGYRTVHRQYSTVVPTVLYLFCSKYFFFRRSLGSDLRIPTNRTDKLDKAMTKMRAVEMKKLREAPEGNIPTTSFAFYSVDSEWICGDTNGSIHVFGAASSPSSQAILDDGSITSVAIQQSGEMLLVSDGNNHVHCYQYPGLNISHRSIFRSQLPVTNMAFCKNSPHW